MSRTTYPARARGHSARAVLGALSLLALGACADGRAQQAALAQQLFVGMPKQTLLSCAGVPERSAEVDNLEFYTYTSRRVATYPSSSLGLYGSRYRPSYAYGLGYAFPPAYDVVDYSCDATFTLRNGVVERLVYGGDGGAGSARLGQCYAIVENCLAVASQQPRIQAPTPTPAPAPRP